jgi:PAS domain S-box-containing protein
LPHHCAIIPSESYTTLLTPGERFRSIALLQQRALSLEQEIVQRKKAETLMARREKELADFRDLALQSMHEVGPDGKILWANKAELDGLGYEPEDYIGHHIAEFHVDAHVIEDILAKLLRGEALYDYPARLRCKDGSVRDVVIHSNGFFEDGTFIHSRCFTRDITERKRAEQEIRRLNEELELKVKDYAAAIHQLERSSIVLSEKLDELETFHDVVVGRELKMIELEKKIQHLEAENARLKTDSQKTK